LVSSIRVGRRTVRGVFLERPNRFLSMVRVGEEVMPCFLPNPGRMVELLVPGTKVILSEVLKEERKTCFDLVGVFYEGRLVSVDSRVPNRLVLEALRNRDLEEFLGYDVVKPEYGYGHSRFDFFLSSGKGRCLLEVKSCTLVEDGVALFPDAVTLRGRRHVTELAEALNEGYRACVLFVIQRTDARVFAPNDETDPKFSEALRDAASNGVEVYAYSSEFRENVITLRDRVPVRL
jgi:sugar fermentation stimulation protein A